MTILFRHLLAALLLAALLAAPAAAQMPGQPGGGGAASEVTLPEIPPNMTREEALRFAAGLTDAQTRLLVLERIDQMQAEEASARSEPGGLAVFMLKLRQWLETKVATLDESSVILAEGFRVLPQEVARTFTGIARTDEFGWGPVFEAIGYILAFLAIGFAAQAGVNRWTAGFRANLEAIEGASFLERLFRALFRALLDLLALAAFALVSLGLTQWFFGEYPVAKAFISTYITAGLIVYTVAAISRFVLAPSKPALRLLPMPEEAAGFLHRALVTLSAVASLAWLSTAWLIINGEVPIHVHLALVELTGAIVLGTVIVMVWHVRKPVARAIVEAEAEPVDGGPPPLLPPRFRDAFARSWHWLATGYILIVAAMWSVSMLERAKTPLWPSVASILVVAVFPLIDRAVQRAIGGALSALTTEQYASTGPSMGGEDSGPAPELVELPPPEEGENENVRLMQRIARIALIALTAVLVLRLWGFDVMAMVGAPGAGRLWDAAFDIGITLLIAFMLWRFIEGALTKRKRRGPISLTAAQWENEGGPVEVTPDQLEDSIEPEDLKPDARARTLLPLIRKFILIVLSVMVVLIILSSIGVDIAPLLAGAGIVGLAIGFGAQALVRDVVSGVFFLIDDAFRVGEYIEMGNIRGEVESISLRSMRLRHHRGAIHTIPFGEVRSITNYNRDWVIYKMPMRVAPDTDPQQVKKIIKKIGQELMDDPIHGKNLIEPLKSQGVYAIDEDSAMIIRVKFMCKPREQFVLRREAYHRIQKAFAEAGIEFARRKVEVTVPHEATPEETTEAIAAAAADADARRTAGGGAKAAADAQ